MKTCAVFTICLLLLIPLPCANAQEANPRLTNDDVVKMVQAGVSTELIMSKIRKSETDFDTSPSALAALPKRGVPNQILLAMLESDPLGSNAHVIRKNGKRITAAEFKQLQASVLTVWSEFGSGSGFIISENGLVLTSQHVIGPSEYLAVQFDKKRKLPAKLLAVDPITDVAVLWVNLAAIPDAGVAPLATSEPSIVENERVVTIGSPLNERKVFTTGTANKVEKRSIVSDINLNRSEAGGPLFSSLGEAAGIITFLRPDVSGPSAYGILRIEQTFPLLDEAKKKMRQTSVPPAKFLPVDPSESFPLDAIKAVATAREFEMSRYSVDVGDFNVLVMTPAVRYRLAQAEVLKNGDVDDFEELKNRSQYISANKPVLFLYVAPRSGESESEFYKLRLFCRDREVEPIRPLKVARATTHGTTLRGIYAYSPTAVSADCGTVTLEIHSDGNPPKVRTRELDRKLIARVDDDFSPYYQKYGRPPLTLLDRRSEANGKNKWWEFSKPPKQH